MEKGRKAPGFHYFPWGGSLRNLLQLKTVESQVAGKHRMLAEERRQKVQKIIEEHGRVTIEEIVDKFKISAVTARADLDVLAERGNAVRSHGGAVRLLNAAVDYPLRFKESLHHAEKVRIGQAAAQLLRPHQTIVLDSGTTTAQIARHIRNARVLPLTVITNALNVAYELAEAEGISLIMIGGILRSASSSFVGPQAERMLQDLHADHLFLAVDGLHPDAGYSTPDILEAQLNAMMIRIANEVTVVADASKFGRRSLSIIGRIECAKRIITDDRVDPEVAGALRAKGVELMIV
jgi:DeoR/GlpR family transcriptional regulator of sugar metabolism